MFCMDRSLQRVRKTVEKADDQQIYEILKAIIACQERKYPDYEMLVLSLPKYDYEKREQQLAVISEMIKNIHMPKRREKIPNNVTALSHGKESGMFISI